MDEHKFSPEVRERAVRVVQEQRGEYPSLWAAIESIAPKIGGVPQALNGWFQRAEVDAGAREGVTSCEAQRMKELEREVRGTAPGQRDTETGQRVFRPGGARPPTEVVTAFIDKHRDVFGGKPKVLQVAPSAYWRHAAQARQALPPMEAHVLDAGHLLLETHADQSVALMWEVVRRGQQEPS